jgi:hypothetical protein
LWLPKRIDKYFYDSTYKKSGKMKSSWVIDWKQTKKRTDKNAKKSPICSTTEMSVNPPRELRICVSSILCDERSGDELIKQYLKEWEKGWQSR